MVISSPPWKFDHRSHGGHYRNHDRDLGRLSDRIPRQRHGNEYRRPDKGDQHRPGMTGNRGKHPGFELGKTLERLSGMLGRVELQRALHRKRDGGRRDRKNHPGILRDFETGERFLDAPARGARRNVSRIPGEVPDIPGRLRACHADGLYRIELHPDDCQQLHNPVHSGNRHNPTSRLFRNMDRIRRHLDGTGKDDPV